MAKDFGWRQSAGLPGQPPSGATAGEGAPTPGQAATRYSVIGVPISATTKTGALEVVRESIAQGRGGYVCFSNVHLTVTARRWEHCRRLLTESLLTVPDGRPIYWAGKLKGAHPLEHITGFDFLTFVLAGDPPQWARHYFYGASRSTAHRLQERLQETYPNTRVVGWESPPFRCLTRAEKADAIERIKASGANLVWVGLGAPKQEYWMWENWQALRPAVLLGIGAAFDFHAGSVRRAPSRMTAAGMEWLYRLAGSPRRLGRRYLVTNTQFVSYTLYDWLRARVNRQR